MMECNDALFIIVWTMIMCVQGLHICTISCNLVVQFNLKINCHTTTLELITKHLVAKEINKLCLSMEE